MARLDREFLGTGNEARATLVVEVGPGPLQHHENAVPEADEERDMDERPDEPGDKSRKLELPDLGHGLAPTDDGELSLVEIPEGRAWLPSQVAGDGMRDVLAHLDRSLRHAWQRSMRRIFEVRSIADDEYLRMSWYAAVRLDD